MPQTGFKAVEMRSKWSNSETCDIENQGIIVCLERKKVISGDDDNDKKFEVPNYLTGKTVKMYYTSNQKHCQRHNGSKPLSL